MCQSARRRGTFSAGRGTRLPARPLLTDFVNYGEDIYRPYRRQISLQQRYHYLGNYLTEGFLVYERDEERPGNSYIRKDPLYRSLNTLVTRCTRPARRVGRPASCSSRRASVLSD